MTTVISRSFAGGEISPALYARADLVKYATGLRTCKNFAVARHGGVFNRPGTQFIGDVKNFFDAPRLIPFIFNADQTYILEFGDQYMRIFRNGEQIYLAFVAITGATQSNPIVITKVAHGLSDNDEINITGVVGMTELNGRNFKVANATSDTFTLKDTFGQDIDSTSYGAYVSGGQAYIVCEYATPYFIQDVWGIQYVQSADVVTLVHPNYAPMELRRTGHSSWSLTSITFAPSQPPPTFVNVTGSSGSKSYTYSITAINAETREESVVATKSVGSIAAPSSSDPHNISWTAAAGASEYIIYMLVNGVPGYIGTALDTTIYSNTSPTPDLTDTPPVARNPFGSSGNYPSAVGYFQQRIVFGNTNNNTETIWTSRTGLPYNFTLSNPTRDDDAITFTLAGKQVNAIRHILEVNRLIVLTSGGEWVVEGDSAGILRPTDINARQQAYNGSASLIPLVINGTVIYLQSRGSIVRDLGFDYSVDGYRGNDLTVFASHLFDKYTLTDWAYQQIPHSIVWAARSDGKVLGMTYLREHEIVAWHQHDFGGEVKSLCVVPEGNADALYMVVDRGGRITIERMATRNIDDVVDSIFMDSALTYDGRNETPGHTMALSGGTTWTYDEELTLTSSAAYFAADDVGKSVHLTGSDGTIIRCGIIDFTSNTVVTVRPHKTVPASMQGASITTWAMAVATVSNLWHLEGQTVSVFADGFVVASPNNAAYDTVTVSNGSITLDRQYSVIHVGLPITSDFETLDIETTNGETLTDKNKLVTAVTLFVESSRGIWVGGKPPSDDSVNPLEGLTEMKLRDDEGIDDPVDLETGAIDLNIRSEWNSNGRIFVRQVDPVPLSILAAAPAGLFPMRG